MGIRVNNFRLVLIAVLGAILVLLFYCPATATASPGYTIRDDPTGGDCTSIGTWDVAGRTCTLNTDVTVAGSDGILVADDGITVNGDGHVISGSGGIGYGTHLVGRTGVTIRNIEVHGFYAGIYLDSSHANSILSNRTGGNVMIGISLSGSNDNTLSENSTPDVLGMVLDSSHGNTLSGNNFLNNPDWGLYLDNSNDNTVTGNTICGAAEFGLSLHDLSLIHI